MDLNQLLQPGLSPTAVNFIRTFHPLTLKSDTSRDLRRTSWESADPNGNGLMSLAEADSWIRNALVGTYGAKDGAAIWELFRPCYILAFDRAKLVGGAGGNEEYVTPTEFRFFNAYLCIYAVIYDAFTAVDVGQAGSTKVLEVTDDNEGADDRRIEKVEWIRACNSNILAEYGLAGLSNIDNPGDAFAKMDADGGGMVLFKEWCDYLSSREMEVGSEMGRMLAFRDHRPLPKNAAGGDEKVGSTPSPRKTSIMPSAQFKGDAKVQLGKGLSEDALDFVDCFRAMAQKTEEGRQLRKDEFSHADGNGNGLISLAECDLWIKDILVAKCVKGEGERIWARYRRCYLHAFNRVKNVAEEMDIGGIHATSDDYVDKKEFRLLVGYLCVYVVMFDAFQLIDGGSAGIDAKDDLRIELDEWLASYEKVAEHTLSGLKDVSDPKAIFADMDKDGGGMVLLGEWCQYLAAKEVETRTLLGHFLMISDETRAQTHKKGTPMKASPTKKGKHETAERISALKPTSRFTGVAKVQLGKGVSWDALDFVDCFRAMAQKNEHGKAQRIREWSHADANGNGLISLAECDLWIKDILVAKCVKGEGERIWARYRRCYLHAFNRAKNVAEEMDIGGIHATSDDYVDKKEFRLLVGYLCVYVVMFDAFQLIDGGSAGIDEKDDLRIELDEWLASYEKVTDHTLSGLKDVSDPKAIFADMDKDGGGMVLLGEWCRYLAAEEVKAKTLLGHFLMISDETRAQTHKKGTRIKAAAAKKGKQEPSERISALKPASRFSGVAKVQLGKGVSCDALDFVDCFRAMAQKNEHGKAQRIREWSHADANGNGLISLAECDLWIKDILVAKCVKGEGERIWARYRRCFLHAFNRAKNVAEEMDIGGIHATSDDYVDKKEFRLLVGYLCVYVVMFDAFQLIDGGSAGIDEKDDLRIELDEWLASYEKVTDHTLSGLKDVSDPKAIFADMDKDGGGMVLLGEWCRYLAAEEVEAKTLLGQFLMLSEEKRAQTHACSPAQ